MGCWDYQAYLFLLQDLYKKNLFQVNHLIGHHHMFKRSVILIKAWCYYESRLLGSNSGLFSTYGLEILVLYIFNLYNNDFAGPLQVKNLFALV